MNRTLIVFWLLLLSALTFAGPSMHVKWTAKIEPADIRAGERGQVLITAEPAPGYHIYANDVTDAIPTKLTLTPGKGYQTAGAPIYPVAKKYFDEGFGKEMGKYEGTSQFAVPIVLDLSATGRIEIKVAAKSMACNDRGCDPAGEDEITAAFEVSPGVARPDGSIALTQIGKPAKPPAASGDTKDAFASRVDRAKSEGLLAFMLLSFVGGLLALLTPCVFPMIPITVSFFSKKTGDSQKANYGGAAAYCLGIIATFTALGLIVTRIFGASGINGLANNVWVNAAIFLVFVALGLSLFGLYEIRPPSVLVNALGARSKAAGFIGPVLMGLTFSLTSFTCTVPIVGTILTGAATGDLLFPAMGMIAFSIAFALPFFFLALFPDLLTRLPKSGAWMEQIKIYMGFLELAAALKFLSNIDQVYRWGFITEPVFLAVWFGIMAVAGLQLLGAVQLGSQHMSGSIGWFRRGFGFVNLGLAVYLLAGIEGAPLGEVAAFLPPNPYPGKRASRADQIPFILSYDEGLAASKASGKVMFIDFTGVNCTNCRWMEKNMFTRKEVRGLITSYVPVELYTDRGTPEDLKNQALMQKLSGTATLPVYILMGPDEKVIKVFQGLTRDEDEYLAFLRAAQEPRVADR